MTQYWIKTSQRTHGPFGASQIKKLALQGKLRKEHSISTDNKRWTQAESVKGLVFKADQQHQGGLADLFDEEFGPESASQDQQAEDRQPQSSDLSDQFSEELGDGQTNVSDDSHVENDGEYYLRPPDEKPEPAASSGGKPQASSAKEAVLSSKNLLLAFHQTCVLRRDDNGEASFVTRTSLLGKQINEHSQTLTGYTGVTVKRDRTDNRHRSSRTIISLTGIPKDASSESADLARKDVHPLLCLLLGSVIFAPLYGILVFLVPDPAEAATEKVTVISALIGGFCLPSGVLAIYVVLRGVLGQILRTGQAGEPFAAFVVPTFLLGGVAQLVVWLGGVPMLAFGRWPRATIFAWIEAKMFPESDFFSKSEDSDDFELCAVEVEHEIRDVLEVVEDITGIKDTRATGVPSGFPHS